VAQGVIDKIRKVRGEI